MVPSSSVFRCWANSGVLRGLCGEAGRIAVAVTVGKSVAKWAASWDKLSAADKVDAWVGMSVVVWENVVVDFIASKGSRSSNDLIEE